MSLEEFIDEYVTNADHPLYESDVARLTREDDTEDALAELAKLRARLAAAEAVIAALPRCEDQGCDGKAVREVCYYGNEFYRHCEKHAPLESYDATYAEPLRAYLALVGEEKTT